MSSIKELVTRFYEELWNVPDLELVEELLDPELLFIGSLGPEEMNRSEFKNYATRVLGSLANYQCQVLELVEDHNCAKATVLFSGDHIGDFLGYPPSGKRISWLGTAHFEQLDGKLSRIEIVSDLTALKRHLDGL